MKVLNCKTRIANLMVDTFEDHWPARRLVAMGMNGPLFGSSDEMSDLKKNANTDSLEMEPFWFQCLTGRTFQMCVHLSFVENF